MDQGMWDSLLRELPKIISAIFLGILLVYRDIKSNKTLKENTKITKASAEATKESAEVVKENAEKINEAKASLALMIEEAKEITRKQELASDEALRLAQGKLKESDEYIMSLVNKKENLEKKDV